MMKDCEGYLLNALDEISKSRINYQTECIDKRIPQSKEILALFESARDNVLEILREF